MSKYIVGGLMLFVSVGFNNAYGATRMGKAVADAYFKIDGKRATAVEADKAADDHRIEKCTPVKNTEPPAYKCVEVVKEYSARNGSPSWKRP